MDVLEELRARHRATARYTLLLDRRGKARKVIERDLDYETAKARADEFNARQSGFGCALYVMELQKT